MTCNIAVPGSNVGQDLRRLPQTLQENTETVSLNYATTAAFHFLSNSLFAVIQSLDTMKAQNQLPTASFICCNNELPFTPFTA